MPTNRDTSEDTSTVTLSRADSLDLFLTATLRLASHHSIRSLPIKGRTLADQGLRAPRESSDVDILVDPREFDRFRTLLDRLGWKDRDSQIFAALPNRGIVFAEHSATLLHPKVPTSIDLHRFYPGFLADPELVFEELWKNRTVKHIAHTASAVPNPIDHWMLAMLHILRSPDENQLRQLLDWLHGCSPSTIKRIAMRAVTLGSIGPLREYLLDQDVPLKLDQPQMSLLADWNRLVSGKGPRGARLINALTNSSWRDRPRIIRRALFPPESAVRVFHEIPPGPAGMVRFHAVRLWNASLQVPRTALYIIRKR